LSYILFQLNLTSLSYIKFCNKNGLDKRDKPEFINFVAIDLKDSQNLLVSLFQENAENS